MKFLTLPAIKNVLINTTRFGVANIVSSTESRQGVKAMSTPTYDGRQCRYTKDLWGGNWHY